MQLSVIIVNYNVRFFLEQCLCSVTKALQGIDGEIIVVDNNSFDGSREFFEGRFPEVKFTWNTGNLGFSRANNQGLEQAKGEYILFLNPDTLVPEDCFSNCIRFFEENPQAGALGLRMVDGSGKFLKESKRAFPSPFTSLYKLTGLARLFSRSRVFGRYHLGHLKEDETHEVDVLAGAFMMVPGKVLDEVGSFDEQFFMYGEDVDLSYRIQEAGYKNFYFADTSIIHFKGESTKKGSLNYVRLFYKAMSLFVKKHYGGSKAGIFNLLIQLAIWMRAAISAFGRFIKWVGMPVLDAALILMSFWAVKLVWSTYVKSDVNYSPNLLLIAFPVFTIIFLAASYYSGLYDNGYRQRRLNRSTAIAIVVLLSGYALLPESLRFSRGILVFGSLLAYILISLLRLLLLNQKLIESGNEDDEHRQTVVVGNRAQFERVQELMHLAGMQERVLGRVEVNGTHEYKSIGHISQLRSLLTMYPVKEVVFCEGVLSFKKMIALMEEVPEGTRIRIHASCSQGIVGSDNKDVAGGYVSTDKKLRLAYHVNRRNKNLFTFLISLFFLLAFPVHFFLQKKPGKFFSALFAVLAQKKSWIGYASGALGLPVLRPGILTTTGLPAAMNTLPEESLYASDTWYAKNFTVSIDLRLVWRNYRLIGK